ncbi:uncharacterized protein PAC_18555 [Phialocephala subalpina]|uniref:Uncharacterized protein n=1 Tax=Phialocephala subalpina TaxID=576137 RepID=A0A1L7XUG1_9HELO|nr:uncharacterized protein PAC_18555 [Phialocephala subalpina]
MSKEPSFGQFLLAEKVSRMKNSPVSGQEDGSESETSLDGGKQTRTRHKGSFWVVLPIGTSVSSDLGTFETGFKTEFADARKHIEIVETWFDWGPEFRDNGTMYAPNPGPNKKLMSLLVRITWSTGILNLKHMSLGALLPHSIPIKTLTRISEHRIEMSHTLHCVNHFRRAYYPEIYYPKTAPKMPDYALPHRDHYIEHVRQYIMCHGDMTPTPTRYFKAIDRNYVLSDTKHTCRNFRKLHAWMLDRFNGASSVGRYNGTPGMVLIGAINRVHVANLSSAGHVLAFDLKFSSEPSQIIYNCERNEEQLRCYVACSIATFDVKKMENEGG